MKQKKQLMIFALPIFKIEMSQYTTLIFLFDLSQQIYWLVHFRIKTRKLSWTTVHFLKIYEVVIDNNIVPCS